MFDFFIHLYLDLKQIFFFNSCIREQTSGRVIKEQFSIIDVTDGHSPRKEKKFSFGRDDDPIPGIKTGEKVELNANINERVRGLRNLKVLSGVF